MICNEKISIDQLKKHQAACAVGEHVVDMESRRETRQKSSKLIIQNLKII